MLALDQTVILEIEKPAVGGRMIARADGQVVLVAGGIPGERVSARIERLAKGVAYGQVVAVLEPSSDRREAWHDPLCGGCLYNEIRYERQLAIKSQVIADALGRIGRIPWPVPIGVAPSPEEGYRMRARLHLRQGRLGFFREGSHDVCDARATRQLRPTTCDALDTVANALDTLNHADEAEVDVCENLEASERVVHVQCRSVVDAHALPGLAGSLGLTGITMSDRPIHGQEVPILSGRPHVIDHFTLEGQAVAIRRHVLSFFQGNRFLLQDLIRHVLGSVDPGADVVDLYAGVGLFSVAAAVLRHAVVTAVEGDGCAVEDLRVNSQTCGGQIHAVHEAVETFTALRRDRPAVLIVDPPRTGMSKAAVTGAIGLRAARVVYVSCDVATLARDARRFIDAGYDIRRIDAFDLFPNTPHVETVMVMERR